MNKNQRRPTSVPLNVIVWIACLYFVVPIAWLVISSTKDNSGLFNTFGLSFAGGFHLFENLALLFSTQQGIFGRWLLNTVFYAVISGVGATVLAACCGYALAIYDFRGKRIVSAVIIGAIAIPNTVLALPTFLVFSAIHLGGNPLSVILPSMVSPFGVFLMRVYVGDAVDVGLVEASRLDGAGEFRTFRSVCLKLLAPGMVTVFIFTTVATWNNYLLPLIMLNSSALQPVTVGLNQWQSLATGGSSAQVLFTTVITGSLVSIIPVVAAFLVLQRFWQSGLAIGGVKG